MSNSVTDLIVYTSLVALVLVLTKPGSQGPALFQSLTSGYGRIIQAETGQSVTA